MVGQYIANNSSLSPKNYGYARWSDLMRATDYFEEVAGDNHQPSFRDKKGGKPPDANNVAGSASDWAPLELRRQPTIAPEGRPVRALSV